jgi:hypothetical protein
MEIVFHDGTAPEVLLLLQHMLLLLLLLLAIVVVVAMLLLLPMEIVFHDHNCNQRL